MVNPKVGGAGSVLFALVIFSITNQTHANPLALSATVQKSPPAITVTWPNPGGASGYTVYRSTTVGGYAGGGGSWGSAVASLSSTTTSYADTNVTVGTGYEYHVVAGGLSGSDAYIFSGIELPLVENRGKIILMVDDAYTTSLAFELDRLQKDLVADGWTVLRHDVSRTNTAPAIKAIIKADYLADTTNVASVLLFGHIPIAYSGWINPDGHGSRPGPTDTYYADMHGSWTDSTNYKINGGGSPAYPWWVNTSGDGKFDQTTLPADTDLQVGRVDFYDMPSFQVYELYEEDLLRRYLNKDHNFRTGVFSVANRGATMTTDTGNYCMNQFFGPNAPYEIPSNTYLPETQVNSYLWFTKGTGGGSYNSSAGMCATADLAASPGVKVVFNSWFASYFWEWDVEDSFLRAPLAADGYGLVNLWADNPCWVLHHMAMGKTIGYATRISQINNGYYNLVGYPGLTAYRRGIQMSLMGDPSLRMHVVTPPTTVFRAANGSQVNVSWNAAPQTGLLGYHVYRATSVAGPFARLNGAYVTSTSFTDAAPLSGPSTYMVKAVRVETAGGSGTYINSSEGAFEEQAPRVVKTDDCSGTQVLVVFDKALDATKSQVPGNYSLSGGVGVRTATLQTNGHSVLLTTTPQSDGANYMLTLAGITDTNVPANTVPANTQVAYSYNEIREYDVDRATTALWHLNGDGTEAGGHGYTLAMSGGATFAQKSPVGAARQCLRVYNVGDTAVASLPGNVFLPSAGSAFTIEARIFVNAWKSYGVNNSYLVNAYRDYNAFFGYDQGVWDTPAVGRFEVANAVIMSNTVAQAFIPMGRWVHIAIVFDGANNYVYIDKVLRAGPVAASPTLGSSAPLVVTLGNFDGYIDEVRLSSVARTFTFDNLPPTNLTASASSASQINLNWSDIANETGYLIERWDGTSTGFVTAGTNAANATSFADIGLLGGTKYTYRVRAFNATDFSDYSPEASATTQPSFLIGSAPRLTVLGRGANGAFLLHVDASAGPSYVVEASQDLRNWSQVLVVPNGGATNYTDASAVGYAGRYYRTAQ